MSMMKSLVAALWFAVAAFILSMMISTDARALEKAVDPAAVSKLNEMADCLDALKELGVRTPNEVAVLHAPEMTTCISAT